MVGITTVDNTDAVNESADNMPKVAIEDAKTMVAEKKHLRFLESA